MSIISTLYYESSLAHHGIKGQKWGVRRYQNPDGSLTAKGRKRLTYLRDRESKKVIQKYHIKKLEESVNIDSAKLKEAKDNNKYDDISYYQDKLSNSRFILGKGRGYQKAELDRINEMHIHDFKEEEIENAKVVTKRILGTTGLIALSAIGGPAGPIIGAGWGTVYNLSIPNSDLRKTNSRIPYSTQIRIVNDEYDKELKRRRTGGGSK